jgi:hypothetical protein
MKIYLKKKNMNFIKKNTKNHGMLNLKKKKTFYKSIFDTRSVNVDES